MEDILASIRRILNDDEPAAGGQEPPHAAEPEALHAPADQDDVFVLDQSMLVEEPHASPPAAAAVSAPPPVPAAPAPVAAPAPPVPPQQATPAPMIEAPAQPIMQTDPDEPLMAPSTAAAASASMGALVRVVGQQQTPVYRGGPTLEDMVRDEIRPLVKSWLDEHLAPMVERMVRAEIARVTEGK